MLLTVFRLIRDYSDFLGVIFVLVVTLSIAAVCAMMLLLNMKKVIHPESLLYYNFIIHIQSYFLFFFCGFCCAIGYQQLTGNHADH